MSRLYLVLVVAFWSQDLFAQGTVVVPEPALDAGRATLRDELLRFRDTLSTIDAAAARLQRDNTGASPEALVSRARVMSDACARSVRNTPPARRSVLAADANNKARLQRQQELLQALDRLRGVLTKCEAEFRGFSRPGQGETVRGYGNDRAGKVQTAVREYETVLSRFLHAMGIKVGPLGAKSQPVQS
jgi:hypothetical protein